MSMHNVPLTDIELNGLIKHGLDIGTPSQIADAFRRGVAWASDHYIERLRVIHEHLTRHDCSFDVWMEATDEMVEHRTRKGSNK